MAKKKDKIENPVSQLKDESVPVLPENRWGLEGIGEAERIAILVNIENLARLPKILMMIREKTGRRIDPKEGRFSFSPLTDTHQRVERFLRKLSEKLESVGIRLNPQTEQIKKVLKSFARGLTRHSEADLLRALGVLCNEQLQGPRTFHLDVTNACNSDCIYCWFHSPFSVDRADADKFDDNWCAQLMPWEMFQDLVDDLAAVGCQEDIVLSGKGEPLLHPRIADMMHYLKKRGLFTTLFTNGLLLDEKVSKACIAAECGLLYVSFSAATQETFDTLQQKPGRGAFAKIIKNVEDLIDLRTKAEATLPRVVLVDVLCHRNAHEIEDFAQLAARLKVDLVRFQLAAIEPYNQSLKLSAEQLRTLPLAIERAKEIANQAGIHVVANIDAQLDGHGSNWSGDKYLASGCLVGWTFARAWADGTLSFCCSPKPIGNLKDRGFLQWWQGQEYDIHRLAGKYIAQYHHHPFADGTPLWNDICTRCPNYEGIEHLERILADLGFSGRVAAMSGKYTRTKRLDSPKDKNGEVCRVAAETPEEIKSKQKK